MKLIDLEDTEHCIYVGNDGKYEKWNIDPYIPRIDIADQTGIEKALESIAIDMHKQTRLMQELIMTLEKMRKGQR